jgi:hypothetical protein
MSQSDRTANRRKAALLAGALVLVGTLPRFLPHAPNFAPVAAVALFAGVYLPKRWSIVVPLAVMVLSDAVIGFHNLVLFTWGSMAVSAVLGWWVRTRVSPVRVLSAALVGSLQFFLVTNFGVWAMGAYARDGSGLVASYVAGLPFLRNTLLGDLFYSGVLFGSYALVTWAVRRRASTAVIAR